MKKSKAGEKKHKVTHLTSQDGFGQIVERVYKYKCINCGRVFDLKSDFIKHLKSERDGLTFSLDVVVDQLEELGVTTL